MASDPFLIDSHKLLWHLNRLHSWYEGKAIAPLHVEISPTAFCDCKCIFCGLDYVQGSDALDTQRLEDSIKDMAHYGARSIVYAGEGEPLLHEDITRIIRYTNQRGISTAVTTNGLTETDWNAILPYLTWLRFSVNAGSADVYAKVHQVPRNCFSKLVAHISDAVGIKKKIKYKADIGVQIVVLDENFDDIEPAIKLFEDLEVDYISIKPYSQHPSSQVKLSPDYSPDRIQHLKEITSGHPKVIFRETGFQCNDLPKRCLGLPFWAYIDSKGDYYACSTFIGDERFKAGNIYKDHVSNLFYGSRRGEINRFARERLDVQKECRKNCRMSRINEFLEMLKTEPKHMDFI